MGIHMTDWFIALLGEAREVHTRIADRVLGHGTGDTIAVTLEFANGAIGYFGTTMMTAYLWHVRVLGSKNNAARISPLQTWEKPCRSSR